MKNNCARIGRVADQLDIARDNRVGAADGKQADERAGDADDDGKRDADRADFEGDGKPLQQRQARGPDVGPVEIVVHGAVAPRLALVRPRQSFGLGVRNCVT